MAFALFKYCKVRELLCQFSALANSADHDVSLYDDQVEGEVDIQYKLKLHIWLKRQQGVKFPGVVLSFVLFLLGWCFT